MVNLFLNFVFHFYDAGLQVFVIRKKKENSSSLFQLLLITDSSPSWDFSLKRCNSEIARVVGTDNPNIKLPNLGFGFLAPKHSFSRQNMQVALFMVCQFWI